MAERTPHLSKLTDVPQSSIGAPEPLVLADGHRLSLLYYLQEGEPHYDAIAEGREDWSEDTDLVAVVRFERPYAHVLGPPNDEAIAGHPYASLGLGPYDAFEVMNSDWIKMLCDRNRVHERHSDSLFDGCRHFIFTFHDETFEIVANGYAIEKQRETKLYSVVRLELNRWANG